MRNVLLGVAAALYGVAVVAPILGPVFIFVGYMEDKRATDIQPHPQTIASEQLIDRGPGSNRHVEVSGLQACSGDQVIDYHRKGKNRVVYLPAYSQQERSEPMADQLRLIVKLWKLENDDEVYGAFDRPSITGFIDNGTIPLGADVRQVLSESYPGIDIDQCQLLIVGGYMPSTRRASVMKYGGAAAFVFGCLVWIATFMISRSEQRREKGVLESARTPDFVLDGIDPTF